MATKIVPMTVAEVDAFAKELQFRPINTMPVNLVEIDPQNGVNINWDLQSRVETNGDDLIDSIRSMGLNEPLEAWKPEGGSLELLRGHRRRDALLKILEQDEKGFLRVFPKGLIPCKVYTDITEEEALRIRADHGFDQLKQRLGTKVEAVRLTSPLYRKGLGEKQVMGITWDAVCPIMSKQYGKLKAEIAAIKDAGQKLDRLHTSQKGNFQFLKRMSEAPDMLLAYWIDGENGGESFSTQKHYEDLSIIFLNEVKDDIASGDIQGFNRAKPGPIYLQAFTDYKKEKVKGAVSATATVRPIGKKKMEDRQASCQSTLAKLTFNVALGLPEGNFEEQDRVVATVETAYSKSKVLMDNVVMYLVKNEGIPKAKLESILKILK